MTSRKTKTSDQFDEQGADSSQFENESGPTYTFTVGADRTGIDGVVYGKGDTIDLTATTAARLRHGGIKLDCDAETEAAVQVAHDILFNAAPS